MQGPSTRTLFAKWLTSRRIFLSIVIGVLLACVLSGPKIRIFYDHLQPTVEFTGVEYEQPSPSDQQMDTYNNHGGDNTIDVEIIKGMQEVGVPNTRNGKTGNTHAQPQLPGTCVKRLPQAIIVGIMKSGTGALLSFLDKHPNIVTCSNPVETKFFSTNYFKGLEYYRNLMPCSNPDQITIEKTPVYFYNDRCPERIRDMDPATKIIVIIKEPILRAQSDHAMQKEHGQPNASKPFLDTVLRQHQTVNTDAIYVDRSYYARHMLPWLRVFKFEQFCFVDGHMMEKRPAEELRKVETFLNVPHYLNSEMFVLNKTKSKYCYRSKPGADLKCMGKGKGRSHPKLNAADRAILEEYFKPRNDVFFKMIRQKYDWGY